MPGYDPASGVPYGVWLRDKGVGYNPHGRSRTERVIDEGHLTRTVNDREVTEAYQTRQDELGNRVRERSSEMGVSTGQDVTVRAPQLAMSFAATERRQA